MRRVALAAIATLAGAGPATAQALVLALSTEEIRIASNFTGADVSVFAVVDSGGVFNAMDHQLIVVMEGPNARFMARRKDSVLGLWINRGAVPVSAPEFYAIEATAPLGEIAAAEILADEGVGVETQIITPTPGTVFAPAVIADFRAAFIRLQQGAGLYSEAAGLIDTPGAGLYRATFQLPANIPVGVYTVSALLFRGGELVGEAADRFEVTKTGAEQFLFDASREWAWPYAFAIVIMAIFTGWLGGVIFRRD
ncbi:MAG: TIGR02186 family protein [Bauldia sp.]|nr:TIGR02186 family protein [Bauldia sp.]